MVPYTVSTEFSGQEAEGGQRGQRGDAGKVTVQHWIQKFPIFRVWGVQVRE